MESTRMLTCDELMECLGSGMSSHASFNVLLTPKERQPRIFDATVVGDYDMKYTAIQFESMNEARRFIKQNTAAHEFRGLFLFQKKIGDSYILGEWAGSAIRDWVEESGELWEFDGQQGRKASKVLKKAGYGISKCMFNLHDKNGYIGDLDDIYINPLTSVITVIRLSPTKRADGIKDDLDHLSHFLDLCYQKVHTRVAHLDATDYMMFKEIYNWACSSNLRRRDISYIICHAPIFWWRFNERFSFANLLWQLGKEETNFYQYVTFTSPSTRMANWLSTVIHDDLFGEGFNPKHYDNSKIMDFHRYAYNHFGAQMVAESIEAVDERLMELFPDAFPKAYVELFKYYLNRQPGLIRLLKFGQYPLNYGAK